MPQPATLQFLRELAAHNTKDWFDAHRADYDAARKDFEVFIDAMRIALLPIVPDLEGQRAKDLTFRIFRDVRFSKDKHPYKGNFGAYFSRGGKKSPDAGYYLHLEPGKSFLAAGLWMPEGPMLKAVRQEIDYNLDEFRSIVENKKYTKVFKQLEGESLKTPPQGFAADHPGIAYLKRKSFISSAPVPDEVFTSNDAVKKCTAIFSEGKPLVDFLNRAMDGVKE
jgi:uncharacterized protein (TIGR02453 family)